MKFRPAMYFYFGPLGHGRRFVANGCNTVAGTASGFFVDAGGNERPEIPVSCLYPMQPQFDGADADLEGEDAFFHEEIMKLRGALRYILSQRGDDLCWRDFYTVAAGVLPEKEAAEAAIKSMPPPLVMMFNCGKFVRHLCDGREQTYVADSPEAIIEKQAARIKELEERLDDLGHEARERDERRGD